MGHPGEGDAPKDAGGAPDANAGGQPKHAADDKEHDVAENELTARAPVTKDRVKGCLTSATYWARALPLYADREQFKADTSSLLAAALAAISGAAIWPVLTGVADNNVSAVTPGSLLFSALAITTAILAALPKIYNWGEMASKARELASQYGSVVGDLRDLLGEEEIDPIAARPVVEAFDRTKSKKDELRRLPNRDAEETRWAAYRTKKAQAEAIAAEAELNAAKAQNALARERRADHAAAEA